MGSGGDEEPHIRVSHIALNIFTMTNLGIRVWWIVCVERVETSEPPHDVLLTPYPFTQRHVSHFTIKEEKD